MVVLKRRLTRIDALAVSLGAVIGVGVFRNTGVVLSGAGGYLGATLVWLSVGLVCLTGAILYADLSARIPEAGGGYAYVRVAFGGPASFLYGWMNAGVAIPVRQATVYAAIGERLTHWFPISPRWLAAATLLVLAGMTLMGVRVGAIAQRIFTSGKLVTISLVIGLSLVLGFFDGGVATTAVTITTATFATAVAAAWFTHLGWQDVVLLAEELHHPRRDLPVVLATTVLLTMALYLSIHGAVYFAFGGGPGAFTDWPAVEVAKRLLGSLGAGLLSVLLVSSMCGVAAEGLFVRTRVAMALARDGMGPRQLAAVNRAGTPYGALLMHVWIVLALVTTNSFTKLLPLVAFSQGFLGLFETASYFVARRKRPELPTSRFHPWAPLVFMTVNAALCVLSGMDAPLGVLMTLGIVVVIAAVYAIKRPQPRPPQVQDAPL
jgi:basic amino acid/polyamine antiporter, APA family